MVQTNLRILSLVLVIIPLIFTCQAQVDARDQELMQDENQQEQHRLLGKQPKSPRKKISQKLTKPKKVGGESKSKSKAAADSGNDNPSTQVTCFNDSSDAGALANIFLASLWYELTSVSSCQQSMSNALNKMLSPGATVQDADGNYLARGESEVSNALLGYFQRWCQTPDTWLSWSTYKVITEQNVGDDLVWGGNLMMATSTSQPVVVSGWYIFIQLGGGNGGFTLRGYDASRRTIPLSKAQECYQPVIYGMVQMEKFAETTNSMA